MTRLFLAAGVAALAIAAPASAKPGGNGGHDGEQSAAQVHGGGHGGGNVEARGGSRGGGGGNAIRMQSRGGGHGGEIASPRMQRQVFAIQEHGHGGGGRAMKIERTNVSHANVVEQRGRGSQMKLQRIEQRQVRNVEHNQMRGNQLARDRGQAMRAEMKANRLERVSTREALRDELRTNRIERLDNGMFVRNANLGTRVVRAEDFSNRARGYGVGGCPPGLMDKGCMPPGLASKLLGTRISDAARIAELSSVPYS